VSAVPEPGETVEEGALDPQDAADQDTLAIMLAGLATIALAAVTPFTVLRLFPWEGTEATEGTRSAVGAPAKSAVGMGAMAASGGASAAAGAAGAGAGGAAAGQAGGGAAAGASTAAGAAASRSTS
jgi:type IV secretion system protein TrbL